MGVYAREYDEKTPVICMDEKPFQLIGESTAPLKMSKSNHKEKYDCEYDRKGTCSIFMFTEPLSGWRSAVARPRRTCEDWAEMIKWLLDECYPSNDSVVLVMDNLNTHTVASLYKRFTPEEAFRLSQRLQIHKTPKHGSWLNIAELELSALTIQCLSDKRIPTIEILNSEISAWHNSRNSLQKGVSWHFSSCDARIKLKHLYPIVKF